MEQGFNSLSVELIAEVLSFLRYHDLLRCRQVSRKLRDILAQSSALQYKLELGLTGNQDGTSSRSIPQRLEALRRMQRKWEVPNLRLLDSMTVPSRDWAQSKWQKDVFFGRHRGDDKALKVFNISSAYAGQERLQHLDFDVKFDVYCVDVDQDLVALARCSAISNEAGFKAPPLVYLRSFKRQNLHPRAQQAHFNLASYGFASVPYTLRARMQIAGEYLMLILHKSLPVESIIVWHWPSGLVNAMLRFTPENACLNAMCIDSGHMLIARRSAAPSGWFGVYVYALNREEESPSLLATFELPRLRWDIRGWMTASFFPRDHSSGVLTGGLVTGTTDFRPASVLVQLQWDRQFTLYTPLVTFLSPEILASRRITPLNVPWSSWGPKRSRVFNETGTVPVVCGYRVIFPTYILDFTPATLQNFSRSPVDGTAETHALYDIETGPTIISSPMFVDPVITSLPYHLTMLDLPPAANTLIARSQMNMAFVDVDGPKLIRATCEDFILIPSSLEIFSINTSDEPPQTITEEQRHLSTDASSILQRPPATLE